MQRSQVWTLRGIKTGGSSLIVGEDARKGLRMDGTLEAVDEF